MGLDDLLWSLRKYCKGVKERKRDQVPAVNRMEISLSRLQVKNPLKVGNESWCGGKNRARFRLEKVGNWAGNLPKIWDFQGIFILYWA